MLGKLGGADDGRFGSDSACHVDTCPAAHPTHRVLVWRDRWRQYSAKGGCSSQLAQPRPLVLGDSARAWLGVHFDRGWQYLDGFSILALGPGLQPEGAVNLGRGFFGW